MLLIGSVGFDCDWHALEGLNEPAGSVSQVTYIGDGGTTRAIATPVMGFLRLLTIGNSGGVSRQNFLEAVGQELADAATANSVGHYIALEYGDGDADKLAVERLH